MYYIISFCIFILGLLILTTKELSNNRGSRIDLSENNIYLYVSFSLFIIALYPLYLKYKSKNNKKQITHSICPKCEETFNYHELQDGMCPHCDIPTKDLDGYYDSKND